VYDILKAHDYSSMSQRVRNLLESKIFHEVSSSAKVRFLREAMRPSTI